MAYYVRHQDLKKDRRAVDLSKVDAFCKEVIRKDKLAEENRKQNEKKCERTNTELLSCRLFCGNKTADICRDWSKSTGCRWQIH